MKKYIILIIILLILIVGVFVGYNLINKEDTNINNIFETKKYDSYKSGDLVNFNNEKWYVMYDSSDDVNYVTLISSGVMVLEDENLSTVISGIYETSKINEYLEKDYVKLLGEDKLIEINGYKARLFNQDDFENLIDAQYNETNDEYIINECPEFICLTNTFYATMIDTNIIKEFIDVYNNVSDIENIMFDDYTLHLRYYNLASTYNTYKLESLVSDASLFVRPVINVYKNNLN